MNNNHSRSDRSLSEQGRKLFAAGLKMNSSSTPPPSSSRYSTTKNAFAALNESEDEEEQEKDLENEEYSTDDEEGHNGIVNNQSPRLSKFSPRWEKVESRRKPPRMQLDTLPITVPVREYTPPIIQFQEDTVEGDLSHLSSMTTDSKGRRNTHRHQHGSKGNRHKALTQRNYNISKRGAQSERDKAKSRENEDDYGEFSE